MMASIGRPKKLPLLTMPTINENPTADIYKVRDLVINQFSIHKAFQLEITMTDRTTVIRLESPFFDPTADQIKVTRTKDLREDGVMVDTMKMMLRDREDYDDE